MSQTILQGNVFDLLPQIKPGSVDCCVTSPPYWLLRSYLPKGHPLKPLELGSEKTPGEFVDNLVRVFRLVRDCLADHGVVFVNIGDSYGQQAGKGFNGQAKLPEQDKDLALDRKQTGIPAGNLCLIPQRLAIALQDDGWVVRSVICWSKPSPMPASLAGWAWRKCRVKVGNKGREDWGVNGKKTGSKMHATAPGEHGHCEPKWTDCPGCARCTPHGGYVLRRGSWRPTSSWEPLLMLAKTGRYFSDGEPVRTPGVTTEEQAQTKWAACRNGTGKGQQEGVYHDSKDVQPFANFTGMANARDVQSWSDPRFRLRSDLTPEQRAYVLQRILGGGLPSS